MGTTIKAVNNGVSNLNLSSTIKAIIDNEIPKGCIFDAHSIIDYLIQNNSDVYLSLCDNKWNTEYYHSFISNTINSFDNQTIDRQGESWSVNIHRKFSKNVCWKKR